MATRILGILDLSVVSSAPDGDTVDADKAIERAEAMLRDGADMIAVSAGGQVADDDAETGLVLPVVTALAARGRVAITTASAAVASAALDAGATVVDDLAGSLHPLAAAAGAAWVANDLGDAAAPTGSTDRSVDIVDRVTAGLAARAERAAADGVEEIWVDPGLGLGKSTDDDVALLANLGRLTAGRRPVAVHAGSPHPAATSAFAITQGAQIIRASEPDVKALKQAAIVAAGHADLRRSVGGTGRVRSPRTQ